MSTSRELKDAWASAKKAIFQQPAKLIVVLVLMLCATASSAQQIQLLSDGTLIIGVVSTAEGTPAADISIQISEAARPQIAVATLQTDAVGIFTYTGNHGASYQISAGDTVATIALAEAPPEPLSWPPIYVTLGFLLLLSLIPARMLRRKELS